MTRRLRNREHPAPNKCETYEIAPDFYNHADANGYDGGTAEYLAEEYRVWRDAVPYKPGMVVWLQCYARDGSKIAKRAYISDVFPERDRYGDRRAKFRVFVETAKGYFSKNFEYTWPGFIERGYAIHEAEQGK